MGGMTKRSSAALTLVLVVLAAALLASAADSRAEEKPCLACHEAFSPGIVGQWRDSKHSGAGVSCFDCHRAEKADPDAFDHYGETIAIIFPDFYGVIRYFA